jgi:hypothetical protein
MSTTMRRSPRSFVACRALAGALALFAASRAAAATGDAVAQVAAQPPPPTPADDPPPAVYGLFPLWEHTGAVEDSGAARVGMRHTQVGIGPVTVGTDPYLDLYGTLNANAKLGIVRRGPVRLAVQAAWLRVPTAAETRGIGNLHAGSFANPYAPVTLLPVAAAVTLLAARRLHLHASATVLQTLSTVSELQTTTGGVAAWVEWWTPAGRSVRFHAGAEGWPVAAQQHVGMSFGWRMRYMALQAGYARRFAPEGTAANTIMFDGAVVFP